MTKVCGYVWLSPPPNWTAGYDSSCPAEVPGPEASYHLPAAEFIDFDNLKDLLAYKGDCIVFMGTSDIPKYEVAFEEMLEK